MKYGYARVLTTDQTPALQLDTENPPSPMTRPERMTGLFIHLVHFVPAAFAATQSLHILKA